MTPVRAPVTHAAARLQSAYGANDGQRSCSQGPHKIKSDPQTVAQGEGKKTTQALQSRLATLKHVKGFWWRSIQDCRDRRCRQLIDFPVSPPLSHAQMPRQRLLSVAGGSAHRLSLMHAC